MIIRIKRKYFGTLEDMLNDDDIAKMYEQTGDTSYSNNNTNTADTNVEKGKKKTTTKRKKSSTTTTKKKKSGHNPIKTVTVTSNNNTNLPTEPPKSGHNPIKTVTTGEKPSVEQLEEAVQNAAKKETESASRPKESFSIKRCWNNLSPNAKRNIKIAGWSTLGAGVVGAGIYGIHRHNENKRNQQVLNNNRNLFR